MADEDEAPTRLTRSFSARLRRKEQVARGEAVPDMPEEMQPAGADDPAAEPDEDAALSDEELLAKYGVEDPEEIEDEDRLDNLLQGQFPDRIRQMALRRMWRLNPLFRFADEMVEYGENYTDAATVIDGMQTAYQVGKGYLQKAFDAVEDDGDELPDAQTPAETPAAEATGQEEAGEATAGQPETAASENTPGDSAPADHRDDARDPNHVPEPAGPGHSAVADDAARIEREPEPVPPPRPRRMTFRKPA